MERPLPKVDMESHLLGNLKRETKVRLEAADDIPKCDSLSDQHK